MSANERVVLHVCGVISQSLIKTGANFMCLKGLLLFLCTLLSNMALGQRWEPSEYWTMMA